MEINDGAGLSTSIASEIASKLTIGMYTPIFAQIDPLRLGEMQAALTIAVEYGTRLNERTQNLKQNALQKLSMQYPSHGFVIDRKEVRQLFQQVRAPADGVELELCKRVAGVFERGFDRITVFNLLDVFGAQPKDADPSEGEEEDDQDQNGAEPEDDQERAGAESADGAAEHSDTPDSGPSQS